MAIDSCEQLARDYVEALSMDKKINGADPEE